MNKKYYWLIGLCVLVFAMFFTNPTKEQHYEKISTELRKGINMEGAGIFYGLLNVFVDKLPEARTTFHNFGILSYTENQNDAIISFGIFGNVFLNPDFTKNCEKQMVENYN